MSCGCKTSGDSGHSCGTKTQNGCEKVDSCNNSYKLNTFDWLSTIQVPNSQKCEFVEVRFKNDRKAFFHNTNNLPLHIGSIIAVEASPGHDIGVVCLSGELVRIQMKKKQKLIGDIFKIYRIASSNDVNLWQSLREKENEIKYEARKIATNLKLNMKLTDVEFQGDGTKLIFYYIADGRVDFRQLIKDYASLFKTKIEMRQIGQRQESSKIGGIGSCGRELCCSTWLTDFRSVSTNAARYQQLSINPVKMAGQCGKLKCCLNFELDSYLDALSHFPSSNTTLDTINGRAFCIKIDVFKGKMWFAYNERAMTWYDLKIEDVKEMIAENKKGEKCSALEDYLVESTSPIVVDLIQDGGLERFDKKKKPTKKKTHRPNQNQNTKPNQEPISVQRDKKLVKKVDQLDQAKPLKATLNREPNPTKNLETNAKPSNKKFHKTNRNKQNPNTDAGTP